MKQVAEKAFGPRLEQYPTETYLTSRKQFQTHFLHANCRSYYTRREPPVLGTPPNCQIRTWRFVEKTFRETEYFLRSSVTPTIVCVSLLGGSQNKTWRKRKPPSNPQNHSSSVLNHPTHSLPRGERVLTIKYPLSVHNKKSIHDLIMIIERKISFQ